MSSRVRGDRPDRGSFFGLVVLFVVLAVVGLFLVPRGPFGIGLLPVAGEPLD